MQADPQHDVPTVDIPHNYVPPIYTTEGQVVKEDMPVAIATNFHDDEEEEEHVVVPSITNNDVGVNHNVNYVPVVNNDRGTVSS